MPVTIDHRPTYQKLNSKNYFSTYEVKHSIKRVILRKKLSQTAHVTLSKLLFRVVTLYRLHGSSYVIFYSDLN